MVGAVPAAASPLDPRRVVLSYQAPAPCPGYAGYVGHVRDRSATLLIDPLPLAAPTPDRVQVRIVPEGRRAGWVGHLSIVGPAALERQVRGERCQDVVAALALITVLRLEGSETTETSSPPPLEAADSVEAALATPRPEVSEKAESELRPPRRAGPESAQTELAPTPLTEPSEPSQVASRSSIDAPPLAAAPPLLAGSAASVAEPPAPTGFDEVEEEGESEPRDDTDATTSSDSDGAALQTSLVGHVGYASVPSHAFKAALQAELRLGQAAASWAGAFGLAYTHGSKSSPSGSVALTLLTAELELCPPGAADPRVWLQTCLHLRGGALALSLAPGARALSTEDVVRPWAALGPRLQLGFPLSASWALRTRAELAVHLVRDRFDGERAEIGANGEPETFTLYRPEAVSFELALGLGYTF